MFAVIGPLSADAAPQLPIRAVGDCCPVLLCVPRRERVCARGNHCPANSEEAEKEAIGSKELEQVPNKLYYNCYVEGGAWLLCYRFIFASDLSLSLLVTMKLDLWCLYISVWGCWD